MRFHISVDTCITVSSITATTAEGLPPPCERGLDLRSVIDANLFNLDTELVGLQVRHPQDQRGAFAGLVPSTEMSFSFPAGPL